MAAEGGGGKKKEALNDCLCWPCEGPTEGWIAKKKETNDFLKQHLHSREKSIWSRRRYGTLKRERPDSGSAFSRLKDISWWDVVADGLSPPVAFQTSISPTATFRSQLAIRNPIHALLFSSDLASSSSWREYVLQKVTSFFIRMEGGDSFVTPPHD